uniref:SANT domain-containing protein n=1 Tax=Steinernema glaseri TaxID=37863 RepID=A0A1I7ZG10_9BILA
MFNANGLNNPQASNAGPPANQSLNALMSQMAANPLYAAQLMAQQQAAQVQAQAQYAMMLAAAQQHQNPLHQQQLHQLQQQQLYQQLQQQQQQQHQQHQQQQQQQFRQAMQNAPMQRPQPPPADDPRRRPSLLSNFAAHPSASAAMTGMAPRLRVETPHSGIGDNDTSSPCPSTAEKDSETDRKLQEMQDDMNKLARDVEQARTQISLSTNRKETAQKLIENHREHKLSLDVEETEEDGGAPLFHLIYADARKKQALRSKNQNFRNENNGLPQYYEPDDIEGVQAVKEKHVHFQGTLVKMIRSARAKENAMLNNFKAKFSENREEWLRKLDEFNKTPKKLNQDGKNRDTFDKIFPELKKRREEEERSGRIADRSADFAPPTDEELKARTAAAIPPLLKPHAPENKYYFHNKNGLVKEVKRMQKTGIEQFLSTWTEEEKTVFVDRLVHYGKNFAAVSVFLKNRSVKDCVRYYYLTKQRAKYKTMFAKRRRKQAKQYRAPVMPRLEEIVVASAALNASIGKVYGGDNGELQCIACHSKIDSSNNPGRVLTRAAYEMFGIDPKEQNAADLRICNKCQAGVAKQKPSGRCPMGGCTMGRRKPKALRTMPQKWRNISPEQRETIANALKFPVETLRVCQGCFKKLSKKLDQIPDGGSDENHVETSTRKRLPSWSQEECALLKTVVDDVGMGKWDLVAEKLGIERFNAEKCQAQFERLMLNNITLDPSPSEAAAANSTGSDEEEDAASAMGDEEVVDQSAIGNEDGDTVESSSTAEESLEQDDSKVEPMDTSEPRTEVAAAKPPQLLVPKSEVTEEVQALTPKSAFGAFGKPSTATNGSMTPKSEPSVTEPIHARGSIAQGTPIHRPQSNVGGFGIPSPFAVDPAASAQNPSLSTMANFGQASGTHIDPARLLLQQGHQGQADPTQMLTQLLLLRYAQQHQQQGTPGAGNLTKSDLENLAALYQNSAEKRALHNPQLLDFAGRFHQQQQQLQQQQIRYREQQVRDLQAREQAQKQQKLREQQEQQRQREQQQREQQYREMQEQQRLREQQQQQQQQREQQQREQQQRELQQRMRMQLQQQLLGNDRGDRTRNPMQLNQIIQVLQQQHFHQQQQHLKAEEAKKQGLSKSPGPSMAPSACRQEQELRSKYYVVTQQLQRLQKEIDSARQTNSVERLNTAMAEYKQKESERSVLEHVLKSLEKPTVANATDNQNPTPSAAHPQVVSKGAMKEFPANLMTRPGVIAGGHNMLSVKEGEQHRASPGGSVIGINRPSVSTPATSHQPNVTEQQHQMNRGLNFFNPALIHSTNRDKIIEEELLGRPDATSPKAQSPGLSTSQGAPQMQRMQRKTGLATVCFDKVPSHPPHRQTLGPRRAPSPASSSFKSAQSPRSSTSTTPAPTPVIQVAPATVQEAPKPPEILAVPVTDPVETPARTENKEPHFVLEAPSTAPSVVEPPSSQIVSEASKAEPDRHEREPSLSREREPNISHDRSSSISREREPSVPQEREPSVSQEHGSSVLQDRRASLPRSREPSRSQDRLSSQPRSREPSFSQDHLSNKPRSREPSFSQDHLSNKSRSREPSASQERLSSVPREREPSFSQDRSSSLSRERESSVPPEPREREPSLTQECEPSFSEDRAESISCESEPSVSQEREPSLSPPPPFPPVPGTCDELEEEEEEEEEKEDSPIPEPPTKPSIDAPVAISPPEAMRPSPQRSLSSSSASESSFDSETLDGSLPPPPPPPAIPPFDDIQDEEDSTSEVEDYESISDSGEESPPPPPPEPPEETPVEKEAINSVVAATQMLTLFDLMDAASLAVTATNIFSTHAAKDQVPQDPLIALNGGAGVEPSYEYEALSDSD